MAATTTSRYAQALPAADKPNPAAGTTITTTAPTTQTQTSGGQSYETLARQNMTPEALASLEALIGTLSTGGTPQQQAEIAKKKQTQQLIEGLLGQYSSGQAFTDAQSLMALNLQQALEKNMPSIQRAIEGAGTSASSAQGLLAQNLSRDAALAAGALGAEQAKAYGGITSSLTSQLAGLAGTAMDPVTQALINALNVSKGAVENTQGSKTSSGTQQTVTSGGTSTSTFAPADYTGMGGGRADAATVIADALRPTSGGTSTIGPTNQEVANIAGYKKAPGVYSDASSFNIMQGLQELGQGGNLAAIDIYRQAGML